MCSAAASRDHAMPRVLVFEAFECDEDRGPRDNPIGLRLGGVTNRERIGLRRQASSTASRTTNSNSPRVVDGRFDDFTFIVVAKLLLHLKLDCRQQDGARKLANGLVGAAGHD